MKNSIALLNGALLALANLAFSGCSPAESDFIKEVTPQHSKQARDAVLKDIPEIGQTITQFNLNADTPSSSYTKSYHPNSKPYLVIDSYKVKCNGQNLVETLKTVSTKYRFVEGIDILSSNTTFSVHQSQNNYVFSLACQ